MYESSNNNRVQFSSEDLSIIEKRFHELILKRNEPNKEFIEDEGKILPEISNDLQNESKWFPVPGMYGGFSYSLWERDGKPILTTSSWIRICGGSGQTHEITTEGCVLVEEGFV